MATSESQTQLTPSSSAGNTAVQPILTSELLGLLMILAAEKSEEYRLDIEPEDLFAYCRMVDRFKDHYSTWDEDVKAAHAQLVVVQGLASDWVLPQNRKKVDEKVAELPSEDDKKVFRRMIAPQGFPVQIPGMFLLAALLAQETLSGKKSILESGQSKPNLEPPKPPVPVPAVVERVPTLVKSPSRRSLRISALMKSTAAKRK